jgi:AraC-like DNA-binding protein
MSVASPARERKVRPEGIDVLSDILDAVRLRGLAAARREFTLPWNLSVPAIRMENSKPAKSFNAVRGGFYSIIDGACWLEVNELSPPLPLVAGDIVVILREQGHRLRGDLGGSPPSEMCLKQGVGGEMATTCGDGGSKTTFISGAFLFEDRESHRLFSALPPYIHIPAGETGTTPWLEESVRFIARETARFHPGTQSLLNQMSHILFVQAIRTHVARLPAGTGNWLAALLDPDIGQAMSHIHDRPADRWTVASLANTVAMSRSSFAARFKQLVGQSPLRYLSHFRMTRAATLLADSQATIRQVASDVGYASEASFGIAFKQLHGVAPGEYRKAMIARSSDAGFRENGATGKVFTPHH